MEYSEPKLDQPPVESEAIDRYSMRCSVLLMFAVVVCS